MELYISNLDIATTEAQLRELLAPFGNLKCSTVRTVANSTKDRKRTFAYIHVDDATTAQTIISKLQNMLFNGRPMSIQEAK